MAYYKNSVIDEIREKVNIVDVIGKFLPLSKKGRNFLALCPFHGEKSPSFTLNEEGQYYKCFGCGVSGNVFTFLMEYEGMSFKEAIEYLALEYDIKLEEVNDKKSSLQYNDQSEKKEKLLSLHYYVAKYFYRKLYSDEGKEALKYCEERKLTKDIAEEFKLGFCPKNTDDLVEQLKKMHYTLEEMDESGIFTIKGDRAFCKFYGRLIFPIENIKGQIIAFGGRIIGEGEPKYLNSKETLIFKKKYNLYGLKNHVREIKNSRDAILTEGYMDTIALSKFGFKRAVASLGTAFTLEQGTLLKRYVNKIYLLFDTDRAGKEATLKAIENLKSLNVSIFVVKLPECKDPDEFLNKNGSEAFKEVMRNSPNALRYLINESKSRFNYEIPEEKMECINFLVPYLSSIKDEILLSEYLKILRDEFSVDLKVLETKLNVTLFSEEALKTIPKRREVTEPPPISKGVRNGKVSKRVLKEYKVLKEIVNNLNLIDYIREEDLEYFEDESIKEMIGYINTLSENNRRLDFIFTDLEKDRGEFLSMFIKKNGEELKKLNEKEFRKYIYSLKEEKLMIRLDECQRKIAYFENISDLENLKVEQEKWLELKGMKRLLKDQ